MEEILQPLYFLATARSEIKTRNAECKIHKYSKIVKLIFFVILVYDCPSYYSKLIFSKIDFSGNYDGGVAKFCHF